jgi:hypothetical protein
MEKINYGIVVTNSRTGISPADSIEISAVMYDVHEKRGSVDEPQKLSIAKRGNISK